MDFFDLLQEEFDSTITIAHTDAGYHVEVEEKVVGTVFPDLPSAFLWAGIVMRMPHMPNNCTLLIQNRRKGES